MLQSMWLGGKMATLTKQYEEKPCTRLYNPIRCMNMDIRSCD